MNFESEIKVITKFEYYLLNSKIKEYEEFKKELYRYVGYNEKHVINPVNLKKLKKDHLIEIFLIQRNMIMKLMDELEETKREEFTDSLDKIFNQVIIIRE